MSADAAAADSSATLVATGAVPSCTTRWWLAAAVVLAASVATVVWSRSARLPGVQWWQSVAEIPSGVDATATSVFVEIGDFPRESDERPVLVRRVRLADGSWHASPLSLVALEAVLTNHRGNLWSISELPSGVLLVLASVGDEHARLWAVSADGRTAAELVVDPPGEVEATMVCIEGFRLVDEGHTLVVTWDTTTPPREQADAPFEAGLAWFAVDRLSPNAEAIAADALVTVDFPWSNDTADSPTPDSVYHFLETDHWAQVSAYAEVPSGDPADPDDFSYEPLPVLLVPLDCDRTAERVAPLVRGRPYDHLWNEVCLELHRDMRGPHLRISSLDDRRERFAPLPFISGRSVVLGRHLFIESSEEEGDGLEWSRQRWIAVRLPDAPLDPSASFEIRTVVDRTSVRLFGWGANRRLAFLAVDNLPPGFALVRELRWPRRRGDARLALVSLPELLGAAPATPAADLANVSDDE